MLPRMRPEETLTINAPDVVLEDFDDEIILVHLPQGAYYSVGGAGVALIRRLSRGTTRGGAVEAAQRQFAGEAEAVRASVEAWLDQMVAEALVRTSTEVAGAPDAAVAGDRPRFAPPTLEKYTDLRDLLLLDPIHDVDPSGWPQRNAPVGDGRG